MRRFYFTLENGVKLTIKPPSLKAYYKGFLKAKTDEELFGSIAEICSRNDQDIQVDVDFILENFSTDDLAEFARRFPKWIQGERDADPN